MELDLGLQLGTLSLLFSHWHAENYRRLKLAMALLVVVACVVKGAGWGFAAWKRCVNYISCHWLQSATFLKAA